MQRLATVKSKTNKGKYYEIRLGGDGKVYCTCPAWKFGRGEPCKHMMQVPEVLEMVS